MAQQIVGIIRELGLHPGDAMPTERDLIDRLRLSRNTVREAIRELRAWGIVDIRHGHGTFVASPSLQALAPTLVFRTLVAGPEGLDALRNLARIREILETSAIGEVAEVLSEEDRTELDRLCDLIGDPETSADADRRFHRLLYNRVDNPLIGQLVDVFWEAYNEAHDQLAEVVQHGQDSVAAHRRIVRALTAHDRQEAEQAMHAHFDGIYARLDDSRAGFSSAPVGDGSTA
ncbi:FadR/GntR family transcriptional regulator [Microlunatus soli]|uniref:FadR/GntR family transcriptional regulator n=1 Tax=Microlunatus soli TaxID=630515 RepID=UPI0018D4990E|nr:FCD domain-containing protein [Microlunatus soli]